MSMTATLTKTTIMNTLASVLPALLSTAGLDDFESYLDEQPDDTEKRILGIYVASETDTTDSHTLVLLIQAQLYRQADYKQEYHSVIMQAIRSNITAELIGFNVREKIDADLWPVDGSSTSYGFYEIEFSEELDDCD